MVARVGLRPHGILPQFTILFELDLIKSELAVHLHHVDVRYENAAIEMHVLSPLCRV